MHLYGHRVWKNSTTYLFRTGREFISTRALLTPTRYQSTFQKCSWRWQVSWITVYNWQLISMTSLRITIRSWKIRATKLSSSVGWIGLWRKPCLHSIVGLRQSNQMADLRKTAPKKTLKPCQKAKRGTWDIPSHQDTEKSWSPDHSRRCQVKGGGMRDPPHKRELYA